MRLKTLKHILNIAIWTIVCIHICLFVALKIPAVQTFVGSGIANALSQKLGTKVVIGNVNIGFFDRVVVDDVCIEDQSHKEMLRAKRISAKIALSDLMAGKISINSAQLIGAHLSLYQSTPTAKPNFQFVIDSLASKDTVSREIPLDLCIGSLIVHHAKVNYDKYFEPETPSRFNLSHIHISDMGANIALDKLTKDTIDINVKKLTVNDQSGLKLKKLSFHLTMGKKAAQLNDFKLEMPNTIIALGATTASYTIDNGKLLLPTLRLSTSITKTSITLSDFSPLYNKLANLDKKILINANLNCANERLNVERVTLCSINHDIDIAGSGWAAKRGNKFEWDANVKKMIVKAEAINEMWTAAKSDEPLPSVLQSLGDIALKANAHCSPNNDLHAEGELLTAVGKIGANMSMDGQRHFSAKLDGKDIDLGKMLNTDQLGTVSAMVDASGSLPEGKEPVVEAKCDVSSLIAKGYTYNNIQIDGQYANGTISGNLGIDDPSLSLALEGELNTHDAVKEGNIVASVKNFAPNNLNLTNKWEHKQFNFDIVADFKGQTTNDGKMKGQAKLELNDAVLVSPDTTFTAGNIVALYDNISPTPRVELNSDFANVKLEGNFDLNTVGKSYANILSKVLPSMPGLPKHSNNVSNDFLLTANVSDTEIFKQLFGLKLSLDSPVSLTTMIEDSNSKAYLFLDAPSFSYDGSKFEGLSLDISQPSVGELACNAALTKVMNNGEKLSARMNGVANDDKLTTSLSLANEAQTFSGVFNTATSFFINEHNQQTAKVEIAPSQMNINGQGWDILPTVVTYSKNKLEVSGFSISNGRDFLAINGKSTASASDSLSVQLQGIDVAYVLNLVNFHAVDFGGKAYGKVYAKALFSSSPKLYGNLRVNDFTFEDGGLGTLRANVAWNNAKGQIDIDATTEDGIDSGMLISGYVSPTHNSIDLNFDANRINLDFLMSFTHAFMSKIDGTASGKMRLVGKFSALDLLGKVSVEGSAGIKVLGCDYTLRGDSVDFVHNDILFNNTRIYDRDGNVGYVTGGLHHDNLRHMTYDLDIRADNLLSYDFDDFHGNPFYATVYASGDVKIHGESGLLKIDVNATPQRGTTFVYNVSSPDAVANQKFIVWNDSSVKGLTGGSTTSTWIDDYDLPSDVRINFIVNCNQNATLKLLMDSNTNDYITLYGDGVINADYYNNGAFKMTGTYRVDHGTYGITIQNIIKKNFVFNPGGTIVFGGNPFDATLNLEAAYTVNGVSLSDLNIGSSFKSNTIKVNCLMNIGGIAQSPVVTFDLDLPTLGTDEKQMVKSVINGEEEMNQQVLYLLGIGRFYPQGNNNSMAQGSNQPDQTSLAMQSLLSGTISSQINQLLNTVVNNNNWNFGANISTGDEGWNNAEYEGILSGQLLNNRLLINGQFGYRDSKNTATTSFIGDFDVKYLLTPNGNLALKVYNQTNDRYFTKSSLNTQGIGFIMKKDFNAIGEFLRFGKKKKTSTNTESK